MTWFVKPPKTSDIGGLLSVHGSAWLTSNKVGIEIPVIPTGNASLTHMMLAQMTIPSTVIPWMLSPSNGGKNFQKWKKKNQAQK